MKKYILPILLLLVSFAFIHFSTDDNSEKKVVTKVKEVQKETKPPLPQIMDNGRNFAEVVLLSEEERDWFSTEKIKKLTDGLKPIRFNPFSFVEVSFPETPESITISEWDMLEEQRGEVTTGDGFYLKAEPGPKHLIIQAYWPDGRQGTYVTKIEVRTLTSYQHLLADKEQTYTVLGFFPEEGESFQMPQQELDLIEPKKLNGNLKSFQESYPELKIKKLPAYYVVRNEKIFFSSNDYKALIGYLNDNTKTELHAESDHWTADVTIVERLGRQTIDTKINYIAKDKIMPEEISYDLIWPDGYMGYTGASLDENGQLVMFDTLNYLPEKGGSGNYEIDIRWDTQMETLVLK